MPKQKNSRSQSIKRKQNQPTSLNQSVRIIGGKWKGRKLQFTSDEDLRPTLGRTRETLFNWLRPVIHDMTCLDLFAGSGVLGFEALSQGASRSTFVEIHPAAVQQLKHTAAALNCQEQCNILRHDALDYLKSQQTTYDLVFLDPPFQQPELLQRSLRFVCEHKLAKAHIYFEYSLRDAHLFEDNLISTNSDKASTWMNWGYEMQKSTKAGITQGVLLSALGSNS